LPDNSVDLVITSPPYSMKKIYWWWRYFCWWLRWLVYTILYWNRKSYKTYGFIYPYINDKVEGGFRHPYVFDLISRLHKETGLKCLRGCSGIKWKDCLIEVDLVIELSFILVCKDKNFKFNIDEMRTEYSPVSIKREWK
jgi:hypothetical protein